VGPPASRWLAPAVRAVVWFLGALTLLALLDRFSAYLKLLTFFRVQYAALLLAAGVTALLVRRPRVAVAALPSRRWNPGRRRADLVLSAGGRFRDRLGLVEFARAQSPRWELQAR
jgi:hypothetical protein